MFRSILDLIQTCNTEKMPAQGPNWTGTDRLSTKAIITLLYAMLYWLYNYGHISHQVDGGFELLAHSQGMETTLGLYQAHARDILHGMKVGVTTHMSLLQYCTRRRDPW